MPKCQNPRPQKQIGRRHICLCHQYVVLEQVSYLTTSPLVGTYSSPKLRSSCPDKLLSCALYRIVCSDPSTFSPRSTALFGTRHLQSTSSNNVRRNSSLRPCMPWPLCELVVQRLEDAPRAELQRPCVPYRMGRSCQRGRGFESNVRDPISTS